MRILNKNQMYDLALLAEHQVYREDNGVLIESPMIYPLYYTIKDYKNFLELRPVYIVNIEIFNLQACLGLSYQYVYSN